MNFCFNNSFYWYILKCLYPGYKNYLLIYTKSYQNDFSLTAWERTRTTPNQLLLFDKVT